MLKSKENQNLATLAYQKIEELIVTLKLSPGTVFSEAELSKQLSIGRTPVREALQRLTADQLVVTLPRRGMMVTEINIGNHLALLETRRVLERLIATKAAKRSNKEQHALLKEYADGILKAAREGDLETFMRFDQKFDRVVEMASGNPFAVKANAPFHAHCRRFWYYYQINGDLLRSARLHAELMQAIAEGDEQKAAKASDVLLDYLEEFTRAALGL